MKFRCLYLTFVCCIYRDYGRLIKLLEFRGIGRLRLCFEAKLGRRLRKAERKEKIKALKINEENKQVLLFYISICF